MPIIQTPTYKFKLCAFDIIVAVKTSVAFFMLKMMSKHSSLSSQSDTQCSQLMRGPRYLDSKCDVNTAVNAH